jgi:hypothetical protein
VIRENIVLHSFHKTKENVLVGVGFNVSENSIVGIQCYAINPTSGALEKQHKFTYSHSFDAIKTSSFNDVYLLESHVLILDRASKSLLIHEFASQRDFVKVR